MPSEKRAAERRKVRLPLSCWSTDHGRPVGDGTDLACHDLSPTGLSFDAETLHRLDSILLAELHLPGRRSPLVMRLRVSRIESIPGENRYRIGALFVDLSDEDREAVVACLRKINVYWILEQALAAGASDVHLTVGRPPIFRTSGRLQQIDAEAIEDGQIRAMLYPLLRDNQIKHLERLRELDFAFSPSTGSRFRANLHYQKGYLEATMRSVPTCSRSFPELKLPSASMERLCRERAGLILIAGTTGSGKTTTMSSMVDFINKNLERVVITIESPIEFTHESLKSVVKQRELGTDTVSYAEALKRCLRQDPDVIVVGELSDNESVLSALRAGETGHLVISTVHAPDSEQALDRIVNLFPPEHAANVCQQLAAVLIGVLYQVLVPGNANDQVPATELMLCNHAIRNMIRERRFNQIPNCIQTGRGAGMHTLQSRLEELRRRGLIADEVARSFGESR